MPPNQTGLSSAGEPTMDHFQRGDLPIQCLQEEAAE